MKKLVVITSIAAAAVALAFAFVLFWFPADDSNDSESAAEPEGLVVCIETGHGIDKDGKWETGCEWTDGDVTYEEAKLMIPIAKAMADYLQGSGVYVYTDAYDDNNRNLTETLNFLDTHRVDAFVNIHCDWEEADSGTMPLYRTEEQKRLAAALNEGVHSEVDIPDRGLTERDDLRTLTSKKVHCPAVLFETGCIRSDIEVLRDQPDQYGKGLAKGMCNYLGIEFTGKKKESKQ